MQASHLSYNISGSLAINTLSPDGKYLYGDDAPSQNDFHLAEDMVDSVTYIMRSVRVLEEVINRQELLGITYEDIRNGMVISAYLIIKQVPGNILIGIIITWVLGIICQLCGLYVPNPEAGFYSLIPSGLFSAPASLAPTFMKLDFSNILSLNFFCTEWGRFLRLPADLPEYLPELLLRHSGLFVC